MNLGKGYNDCKNNTFSNKRFTRIKFKRSYKNVCISFRYFEMVGSFDAFQFLIVFEINLEDLLLELIEFGFLVANVLAITKETAATKVNVLSIEGMTERSQTDKWQGGDHEN
jgi:hypothetical protein